MARGDAHDVAFDEGVVGVADEVGLGGGEVLGVVLGCVFIYICIYI